MEVSRCFTEDRAQKECKQNCLAADALLGALDPAGFTCIMIDMTQVIAIGIGSSPVYKWQNLLKVVAKNLFLASHMAEDIRSEILYIQSNTGVHLSKRARIHFKPKGPLGKVKSICADVSAVLP